MAEKIPRRKLSHVDLQKIGDEINQILNQRFIITIVAITVFGVFSGLTFPTITSTYVMQEVIENQTLPIADSVTLGTIFLVVFLGILYAWNLTLRSLQSSISSYTKVLQVSKWEIDIDEYYSHEFPANEYQTKVFLLLGALAVAWNATICVVILNNRFPSHMLVWIEAAVSSMYFLYVIKNGFTKQIAIDKSSISKWEKILSYRRFEVEGIYENGNLILGEFPEGITNGDSVFIIFRGPEYISNEDTADYDVYTRVSNRETG